MDYLEEIYRCFFRTLIRDVVKNCPEIMKYPENTESPENTENTERATKKEIEYIRVRLRDETINYLFSKDVFYTLASQLGETTDKAEKIKGFGRVNFEDVRKRNKKDLVWILQRGGAIFQYDKNNKIGDRRSFMMFESMLNEMEFSDKEKNIFINSGGYFYFNALTDNGDKIYEELRNPCTVYKGLLKTGSDKIEGIFLIALEKSNLQLEHDKLKDLIDLWEEISEGKQIMDFEKVMEISKYFVELVPVIDKEAILKSEEELNEDQMMIRLAVFKYYMKTRKKDGKKYDLKDEILTISGFYHSLKRFFEEVYNEENFNEEQMMIISKGYFDYLDCNFEYFKNKVAEYKGLCKGLKGASAQYKYDDMWRKVWSDHSENE